MRGMPVQPDGSYEVKRARRSRNVKHDSEMETMERQNNGKSWDTEWDIDFWGI
jgi:hypothetical protein